jgi:hypothetical protein
VQKEHIEMKTFREHQARYSVTMALMAILMVVDSVAGHLFAPSYSIAIEERSGFISGEVSMSIFAAKPGIMKDQQVIGLITVLDSGEWQLQWKGNLLDGHAAWIDVNDQEYLARSQALVDRYRNDGSLSGWRVLDSELSSRTASVEIPPDIPRVPIEDFGNEDEELIAVVVVTGSGVQLGIQRNKRIMLANLRYPHGQQIYMPGPLVSVGARLKEVGYEVQYLDLNMEPLTPEHLQGIDGVGISPMGAPYIPSAIQFVHEVHRVRPDLLVILGGQAIEGLSFEQCEALFGGSAGHVLVSQSPQDFADIFGPHSPDPMAMSYVPAWAGMHQEGYLHRYLGTEMPLMVSQGCKFTCDFCAACKGMREQFRDLGFFESDLRFLCRISPSRKLMFYATSLDFFQNAETVAQYLEVLALVREETGFDIQVRCLSCMSSFIKASETIPNFGDLLRRSGITTVGVGVDGSDPDIWRAIGKHQNRSEDIPRFMELCREFGIQGEALMVMGFQADTSRTLWANLRNALKFRQAGITVRPYCAKEAVPGNGEWENSANQGIVARIMANPALCFNLDFAAFASFLTHPRRFHRWMVNGVFAVLCWIGRSTAPLMPQGNGSRLARAWNRRMPHDR